MLTAFGVLAACMMVVAYGFEDRHRTWIVVFSVACAATAIYGVLTSAWVFAGLEAVWAVVALNRYRSLRARA